MPNGRKPHRPEAERTTLHLVVSLDPQTLAAIVALVHDTAAQDTLVTELTARLRHSTDALARAVTADRRHQETHT